MNNGNYEDEIDRMRMRSRRRGGSGRVQATSYLPEADEYEEGEYETDEYEAEKYDIEQPPRRQARRGKKHGKRKAGIVLLAALLAVVLAGSFLYSRYFGSQYWTVAVFGLDSRDGNLGKDALSDVIMLCCLNKKSGEIQLLSVFRDSYLRIDGEQYDKINEAYFLGGHEQAIDALEDNLDLSIDDYASFNWKAAADALNVLGGVDLEITESEFAYINSFITETVESTGVGSVHLEHSGVNHLDGVQAVAYARLRLMDTDFNRTERQRKVLGLAMEKAKQADAATLRNLAVTVFPQISTSIGIDDFLTLLAHPKKYYINETSGFPFSHTEMKIEGKSCVIPTTLESNVIKLHEFLYDKVSYVPTAVVKSISSEIAAKSGLNTPGEDSESGKNVGAQNNTSTPPATEAAPSAVSEEANDDGGEDGLGEESRGSSESQEEQGAETDNGEESPGPDSTEDVNGEGNQTGQQTETARDNPQPDASENETIKEFETETTELEAETAGGESSKPDGTRPGPGSGGPGQPAAAPGTGVGESGRANGVLEAPGSQ